MNIAISAGRIEAVGKGGMGFDQIVRLVSTNAAKRFGLGTKGHIVPGFEAGIALVDPDSSWVVRAADPFADGAIVGLPGGQYLRRPIRAAKHG